MVVMSSSSTAVLLIQSPQLEQIRPQQPLFPTSSRHLLLASLRNNDGTPATMTCEQRTEANVNLVKHYCCDCGQKQLCKFLPLFFQECLGICFLHNHQSWWELHQKNTCKDKICKWRQAFFKQSSSTTYFMRRLAAYTADHFRYLDYGSHGFPIHKGTTARKAS